MNLIGYIRVSTPGQKDGFSLDEQAEIIQRYCDERGHKLLAIFPEVGSGATVDGRPVLQDALKEVFRQADGIVVSNYDRLSRDVADGSYWLKAFRTAGKLMLSAQEIHIRTDADPNDPFGDVPFEMRMIFAKVERKLIKNRLAGGRAAATKRGSWIGHAPPLGMKIEHDRETRMKRLVVDEAEQRTINRIIELGSRKLSTYQIADILNEENRQAAAANLPIPYPTKRRASEHNNVTVWRVLKAS